MLTREQWIKRKRRRFRLRIFAAGFLGVLAIALIVVVVVLLLRSGASSKSTIRSINGYTVTEMLLTVNESSRPGGKLSDPVSVIAESMNDHGSSAVEMRNYLESLRLRGEKKLSYHFVIGSSGDIVECIPLNEVSVSGGKVRTDAITIGYFESEEALGALAALKAKIEEEIIR